MLGCRSGVTRNEWWSFMTLPNRMAGCHKECRYCLAVTETTVAVVTTAREARQCLQYVLEFNRCAGGVNPLRETSRGNR